MKAFARIAATAALTTAAGSVLAAAPTDGIYECGTQHYGRLYFAMHSQDNGTTIATIPAVVPNQSLYGFSIGNSIGNRFTG